MAYFFSLNFLLNRTFRKGDVGRYTEARCVLLKAKKIKPFWCWLPLLSWLFLCLSKFSVCIFLSACGVREWSFEFEEKRATDTESFLGKFVVWSGEGESLLLSFSIGRASLSAMGFAACSDEFLRNLLQEIRLSVVMG